jgi:hypothetical protein
MVGSCAKQSRPTDMGQSSGRGWRSSEGMVGSCAKQSRTADMRQSSGKGLGVIWQLRTKKTIILRNVTVCDFGRGLFLDLGVDGIGIDLGEIQCEGVN